MGEEFHEGLSTSSYEVWSNEKVQKVKKMHVNLFYLPFVKAWRKQKFLSDCSFSEIFNPSPQERLAFFSVLRFPKEIGFKVEPHGFGPMASFLFDHLLFHFDINQSLLILNEAVVEWPQTRTRIPALESFPMVLPSNFSLQPWWDVGLLPLWSPQRNVVVLPKLSSAELCELTSVKKCREWKILRGLVLFELFRLFIHFGHEGCSRPSGGRVLDPRECGRCDACAFILMLTSVFSTACLAPPPHRRHVCMWSQSLGAPSVVMQGMELPRERQAEVMSADTNVKGQTLCTDRRKSQETPVPSLPLQILLTWDWIHSDAKWTWWHFSWSFNKTSFHKERF